MTKWVDGAKAAAAGGMVLSGGSNPGGTSEYYFKLLEGGGGTTKPTVQNYTYLVSPTKSGVLTSGSVLCDADAGSVTMKVYKLGTASAIASDTQTVASYAGQFGAVFDLGRVAVAANDVLFMSITPATNPTDMVVSARVEFTS